MNLEGLLHTRNKASQGDESSRFRRAGTAQTHPRRPLGRIWMRQSARNLDT